MATGLQLKLARLVSTSVGLTLARNDTGKGEKGRSRWSNTEVLHNAQLLRQLREKEKDFNKLGTVKG